MHGTVHLFDRLPEVAKPAAPAGGAAAPVRQVPLVGVIRNPRSHRNTGAPPEWTGRATVPALFVTRAVSAAALSWRLSRLLPQASAPAVATVAIVSRRAVMESCTEFRPVYGIRSIFATE